MVLNVDNELYYGEGKHEEALARLVLMFFAEVYGEKEGGEGNLSIAMYLAFQRLYFPQLLNLQMSNVRIPL